MESGVSNSLAGNIVSFGVEGYFGGGGTRKVVPDLAFGLEVDGWDKLWV